MSHLSISIEHICIVRRCVRQQECSGEQDTVLDLKSLHRLQRQKKNKKQKNKHLQHRGPCLDEARLGSMAVGEGGALTWLWGCGLGVEGLFQGSFHQEVVPSKHLKKLLTRKRSAKR